MSSNLSHNQMVLVKLYTSDALSRMRRGPQRPPLEKLMTAVEEAIADARSRLNEIAAAGQENSVEYQDLSKKIKRWEDAKRANR